MGRVKMPCTQEGVRDTITWRYGGVDTPCDPDSRFHVDNLPDALSIDVISLDEKNMTVHLQNIDVAFVNALRRIMISEVASVSPETVYCYQNTGIIQDEVLIHRIGLIPFLCDPNDVEMRAANEDLNERNSFKYRLATGVITKEMVDPRTNAYAVYSKDLTWLPLSENQKTRYSDGEPRPVYGNIMITKLGVGQEIELEIYIEKGIGKTHGKWNPVSTASYKYEPCIDFTAKKDSLSTQDIEDLVELCPLNVFEPDKKEKIIAKRPWDCTTCRACIEKHPDVVSISKIRDSYLFKVESIGSIAPEVIFQQALDVLKAKAVNNLNILDSNINDVAVE